MRYENIQVVSTYALVLLYPELKCRIPPRMPIISNTVFHHNSHTARMAGILLQLTKALINTYTTTPRFSFLTILLLALSLPFSFFFFLHNILCLAILNDYNHVAYEHTIRSDRTRDYTPFTQRYVSPNTNPWYFFFQINTKLHHILSGNSDAFYHWPCSAWLHTGLNAQEYLLATPLLKKNKKKHEIKNLLWLGKVLSLSLQMAVFLAILAHAGSRLDAETHTVHWSVPFLLWKENKRLYFNW